MATTRVQAVLGSSASPLTLTLSAAPITGNLLVCWVTPNTTSSHTLSATNGFTGVTVKPANSSFDSQFFYKVAAGDTATIQVATSSAATTYGIMTEWSSTNGWGASPLSIDNGQSFTSTTAPTTPSVTPTTGRADCVVVIGFSNLQSKPLSGEAVSGTNVGTIAEDGDSGNLTAAASGVISSTSGAYQGSAVYSNPGASGVSSIAIFNPLVALPPTGRRILQAVNRAGTR